MALHTIVEHDSTHIKPYVDNVKQTLANISITGTTNTTGATITVGTFFYLNGTLVKAKTDIAANATLTLNTNYEAVTEGGLNSVRLKETFVTVPNTVTTVKDALAGLISQVFDSLGNQGSSLSGVGLWTGNFLFSFTVSKLSSTSAMGYATNGTYLYCFEYNNSIQTLSKLYQFTGTAL